MLKTWCCNHKTLCSLLQVTGKKSDSKETVDFLPEDFKNGEYETAVRLEKQEDLKTLPKHSLTRGNLTYEKEKKQQAEVSTLILCSFLSSCGCCTGVALKCHMILF